MKQHTLVERHHPIFSPIAIISTLILAGTLSIIVFFTGGRAFNPGELSAVNNSGQPVNGFHTHAEFGGDCTQCHTPFKGIEAERCESCHANVRQERQTGVGLHGRLQSVEQCTTCHLDHRGGEYNLLTVATANFDHSVTRFSLARHDRDYDGHSLACPACHTSESDYAISQSACANCHEDADPPFMALHTETYGGDCLACHDGLDTMAQFSMEEHAQVFALTGVHQETPCESCHSAGQFEGTPQECAACHEEPDAHQGLFSTDCTECHTPDGWQPALMDGQPFEHATSTGFSLDTHTTNYDNQPFTCRTCHVSQETFTFISAQCSECHSIAEAQFIVDHTAQFGADCLACHDGTGEIVNFDHAQVWPLEGQHAVQECTACHVNQSYVDTSGECTACHEEPTIHAGLFGLDCANCHTAVAWQPARLRKHIFPLDHGDQGEIACETCHTTTYTQYTCYNCHEHDPAETERKHLEEGISQQELPACANCHPTGREHEVEGE